MFNIGNVVRKVLKLICGPCFDPTPNGDSENVVYVPAEGVPALARDLSRFETISQVPDGLSKKVVSSSKKVQAKWYRKLLEAWKEATPPPKTTEEAARPLIQTLEGNQQADVEGILAFYGLPLPAAEIPTSLPEEVQFELQGTPPPKTTEEGARLFIQTLEGNQEADDEGILAFYGLPLPAAEIPTPLPEGVQFELHTLPVDAKGVGDGDGMTVYVSTADPQESKFIPREVRMAVRQRSEARALKKYKQAKALLRQISNSGYRVINHQNEEILARKYRIRLRGIDAPEMSMPYGSEAKDELVKLVQDKCLRVLVYELDQYDRIVADVYCDGIFVQEEILKRGFAWHYKWYDQRLEFAHWEKEARGNCVGLWASPNPEEPWEWKKKNKREVVPKKKEQARRQLIINRLNIDNGRIEGERKSGLLCKI